MKVHETLFEVRDHLTAAGWEEVEVFYKRGRSRVLRAGLSGDVSWFREEEGWAVRAGDARRSFHYAATGMPRPDVTWPPANGAGLRLPPARPIPSWSPPSSFDAPLLSETEARGLFETIARELDQEVPGARLVTGYLEDGSSESHVLSSRDVAAAVRHRATWLRLVALAPGSAPPDPGSRPDHDRPAEEPPVAVRATPPAASVEIEIAEREARRFSPPALARRLADHLLIATRGTAPLRDRGELLLAPPVMTGLLAALADLWVGPEAERRAAAFLDRRGRLGSSALTLIDDGRLPGGIFESPADGEGQPTREVALIEEGGFRQPLLAWWQVRPRQTGPRQAGPRPTVASPAGPPPTGGGRASGCVLRPGWRDLPSQSPTHLYLRPDSSTGVGALVGSLSRGYYLLGLEGEPRRDADRFAARVAGFAIDAGRPTGPVAGAWLTGTIPALLNGILAVARDLTFLPKGRGLVGSPTVLVRGLELRREV